MLSYARGQDDLAMGGVSVRHTLIMRQNYWT